MIKTNDKYSWDSEKRDLTIQKHGLDFLLFADAVFADPNITVKEDNRREYNEPRWLAYAMVGGVRLCLCFTPRDDKIHLITIFRMHEKNWSKYYDAKN